MRHHPVKACAIINIPPAAPAFEPPPPDIPVLYSPLTGCIQSRCCPAGESWSQSSSCSGHCSAACAAASAGRAWLARGRGRVKGQKSLRSKRVWREGWAGSMTWPLPPSLLRDASHTSGWRDAPWQGAGPFPKMTLEEDDCDDVEEEDDQVLQGEMGTIQGLVYKHSSYQSLPGYFSVFHHPARLPQTDRGKKRRVSESNRISRDSSRSRTSCSYRYRTSTTPDNDGSCTVCSHVRPQCQAELGH